MNRRVDIPNILVLVTTSGSYETYIFPHRRLLPLHQDVRVSMLNLTNGDRIYGKDKKRGKSNKTFQISRGLDLSTLIARHDHDFTAS